MEKFSFFNDINNDRVYYAEDFARHLKKYFTNGIFNNELQVLANDDMTITIKKGDANIEGYRYTNTSDLIKTLEPADGVLNRIDNIIIRLDLTNRIISIQVVKGDFAENPVAPSLVRSTTVYDLRIATISIPAGTTTITQDLVSDRRFFTEECGDVISAVQTPDTQNLFIQIETEFNNLLSLMNSALNKFDTDSTTALSTFDTVYKNFVKACDETFKSKLQGYDTAFSNKVKYWDTDFNNWFDNIKNKLDGDTAGKLQNEIDDINGKIPTKTSQLTNDSDFVTTTDVEKIVNDKITGALSESY